MVKWYDIIIYLLLGLFLVYLLIGFIMGLITEGICKNECENKGGIYSIRVSNGEWNLNDKCICFYENKIESFNLMEEVGRHIDDKQK